MTFKANEYGIIKVEKSKAVRGEIDLTIKGLPKSDGTTDYTYTVEEVGDDLSSASAVSITPAMTLTESVDPSDNDKVILTVNKTYPKVYFKIVKSENDTEKIVKELDETDHTPVKVYCGGEEFTPDANGMFAIPEIYAFNGTQTADNGTLTMNIPGLPKLTGSAVYILKEYNSDGTDADSTITHTSEDTANNTVALTATKTGIQDFADNFYFRIKQNSGVVKKTVTRVDTLAATRLVTNDTDDFTIDKIYFKVQQTTDGSTYTNVSTSITCGEDSYSPDENGVFAIPFSKTEDGVLNFTIADLPEKSGNDKITYVIRNCNSTGTVTAGSVPYTSSKSGESLTLTAVKEVILTSVSDNSASITNELETIDFTAAMNWNDNGYSSGNTAKANALHYPVTATLSAEFETNAKLTATTAHPEGEDPAYEPKTISTNNNGIIAIPKSESYSGTVDVDGTDVTGTVFGYTLSGILTNQTANGVTYDYTYTLALCNQNGDGIDLETLGYKYVNSGNNYKVIVPDGVDLPDNIYIKATLKTEISTENVITVTDDNNQHRAGNGVEFKDVPLLDVNGEKISYKISEKPYSGTITQKIKDAQIFDLYNTIKNDTTNYNEGEEAAEKTAVNDSFLTVGEGDRKHRYQATAVQYSGKDEDAPVTHINILNTLPLTALSIEKTWIDQENKFMLRPDDIKDKLKLYSTAMTAQEGTAKQDVANISSKTFTELTAANNDFAVSDKAASSSNVYLHITKPATIDSTIYFKVQRKTETDSSYTTVTEHATGETLSVTVNGNKYTAVNGLFSVSKTAQQPLVLDIVHLPKTDGAEEPKTYIYTVVECDSSGTPLVNVDEAVQMTCVTYTAANYTYTYTKLLKYDEHNNPYLFKMAENGSVNAYNAPTYFTQYLNYSKVDADIVKKTVNNKSVVVDGTEALDQKLQVDNTLTTRNITVSKEWDDTTNCTGSGNNKKCADAKNNALHYDVTANVTSSYSGYGQNAQNNIVQKTIDHSENKTIEKDGSAQVFEDYPVNDANGNAINWSVDEAEQEYGYVKSITFTTSGGSATALDDTHKLTLTAGDGAFDIKNTLPITSVTVTKTWDDQSNLFGIRPDKLRFTLYRSSTPTDANSWEKVAVVEVNADQSNNSQIITFPNLLKYDRQNNIYSFKVEETAVNGYTTTYGTASTSVTSSTALYKTAVANSDAAVDLYVKNTMDTVTVKAAKNWNDNGYRSENTEGADQPNLHYNVQITLGSGNLTLPNSYQNVKVIPKDNAHGVQFTNLPKTNKYGETVIYTVTEDATDSDTDNTVETVTYSNTGSDTSKGLFSVPQADINATSYELTISGLPVNDGTNNYTYSVTDIDGIPFNSSDVTFTTSIANGELTVTITRLKASGSDFVFKLQRQISGGDWEDVTDPDTASHSSDTFTATNGVFTIAASNITITQKSFTIADLPEKDAENNTYFYRITDKSGTEFSSTDVTFSSVASENKVTATVTRMTAINGDFVFKLQRQISGGDWEDISESMTASYGGKNYSSFNEFTRGTYRYGYEGSSKIDTDSSGNVQFNILNTLPVESFTAQKAWDDEYNRDNLRPDSIDFKLQRKIEGGSDTDVVTNTARYSATADDCWKTYFNYYPQYDASNNRYIYNVAEVGLSSAYQLVNPVSTPDGGIEGYNYLFTNKHPSEERELTVHKIWDDVGLKNTLRPYDLSKIDVELWCIYTDSNGSPVDQPVSRDTTDVIGIKTHIDAAVNKLIENETLSSGTTYNYKPTLDDFNAVTDDGSTPGYNEQDYESTYVFKYLPVYINVDGSPTAAGTPSKWQAVQYYVKETINNNDYVYRTTYSTSYNTDYVQTPSSCKVKLVADKERVYAYRESDSSTEFTADKNGLITVPGVNGETTLVLKGLSEKDESGNTYTYSIQQCNENGEAITGITADVTGLPSLVKFTASESTTVHFKVLRRTGSNPVEVVVNVPQNKTIYVKNSPAVRDILVTKQWNDNGYGGTTDSTTDANASADYSTESTISKNLHYKTAVKLEATNLDNNETYEKILYLSKEDSEKGSVTAGKFTGVVFDDVPIYKKDGTVITYKVTEYKDEDDSHTAATGNDRTSGSGSWINYYTSADGNPGDASSDEFVQLTGAVAGQNGKYYNSYGYVGSAQKYTKTEFVKATEESDAVDKTYTTRLHITDELPLTAVKVNKHWLDQNNEFALRPTGINDKNKSENTNDCIDLTLTRKLATDNNWTNETTLNPANASNAANSTEWYDSTNQKLTPVDTSNPNEWSYTYKKLLKYDSTNTAYNFKITEENNLKPYEAPKYCVADEYNYDTDGDDTTNLTVTQTVEGSGTDSAVETLPGDSSTWVWNGETALAQSLDISNKLDTRSITVNKTWDNGYPDRMDVLVSATCPQNAAGNFEFTVVDGDGNGISGLHAVLYVSGEEDSDHNYATGNDGKFSIPLSDAGENITTIAVMIKGMDIHQVYRIIGETAGYTNVRTIETPIGNAETLYDLDITLSSNAENNGNANDQDLGIDRNDSNGKYEEVKKINVKGAQSVVFENLPKYDKDGKVIVYNVREDAHTRNTTQATSKTPAMTQKPETDYSLTYSETPADNQLPTFTDGDRHYGYTGSAVYTAAQEKDNKPYATVYDIKNTLPQTSIKAVKAWVHDVNMYDPDLNKYNVSNIELSLKCKGTGDSDYRDFNNTEHKDTVVYNSTANSMFKQYDKLPVYDYSNKEFTYKVQETDLKGYNTTYAYREAEQSHASTDGTVFAETAEQDAPLTVTVTNTQITGGVSFTKVDKNHYDEYISHTGSYVDITLPGAKFELYYKTGTAQNPTKTPVFVKKSGDVYVLDNNTEGARSNVVESDSDGMIRFSQLPLNTYYLKEIEHPTGYLLPAEGTYFDFTVDVAEAASTVASAAYGNDFISNGGDGVIRIGNVQHIEETRVTLVKEDRQEPGKYLANATFYLLKMKPYIIFGTGYDTEQDYITAAENAVKDAVENHNGELTDSVHQFWMTDSIISENSEKLPYIYTTDVSGQITPIEKITNGRYIFMEVNAPEGYDLGFAESFEISTSDPLKKVVTVEFKDPRKSASLDILKENEFGDPLDGAKFELYYQPEGQSAIPYYNINSKVTAPTPVFEVNNEPTRPDAAAIKTYKYTYSSTVTTETAPIRSDSNWILPRTDNDYIYFEENPTDSWRSYSINNPSSYDYDHEDDPGDRMTKGDLFIEGDPIYATFYSNNNEGAKIGTYEIWERFVYYTGTGKNDYRVVWKIQPPDGAKYVRFHQKYSNWSHNTAFVDFTKGIVYDKNGNISTLANGVENGDWIKKNNPSKTAGYSGLAFVPTVNKLVFRRNSEYCWDNLHVEFFKNTGTTDNPVYTPIGESSPGYLMEPYAYADSAYRIQFPSVDNMWGGNDYAEKYTRDGEKRYGNLTFEITIPEGATHFRINNGTNNIVGGSNYNGYGKYLTAVTPLATDTTKKNNNNYWKLTPSGTGTSYGYSAEKTGITLTQWSESDLNRTGDDINDTASATFEVDSDSEFIYFKKPSGWKDHIYAYFYAGGDLRKDNWQRAVYSVWPGSIPYGTTVRASGESSDYPTSGDFAAAIGNMTIVPGSTFVDGSGSTIYRFRLPLGDNTNYSKVVFSDGMVGSGSGTKTGYGKSDGGGNYSKTITYTSGFAYDKNGGSWQQADDLSAVQTYQFRSRTNGNATSDYSDAAFIYIKSTDASWDDIHIKFYNASGGEILQTGKGYVMKYAGTQNGADYYRVPVPNNAAKFSINNGSNKSTNKQTAVYPVLAYDSTTNSSTTTTGDQIYQLSGTSLELVSPNETVSVTQEEVNDGTAQSAGIDYTVRTHNDGVNTVNDCVWIKNTAGWDSTQFKDIKFLFYDAGGQRITGSSKEYPAFERADDAENHNWICKEIPVNASYFSIKFNDTESPLYEIYPQAAQGTTKSFTTGDMIYRTDSSVTLSLVWPLNENYSYTGGTQDANDSFAHPRGDYLYLVDSSSGSSWDNMRVVFYDETHTAIENNAAQTEISALKLGSLTQANGVVESGVTTSVSDAVGTWYKIAIPYNAVTFELFDNVSGSVTKQSDKAYEILPRRTSYSSLRNDYTLGDIQYSIAAAGTDNKYSLSMIYPTFTETEEPTNPYSEGTEQTETTQSADDINRANQAPLTRYSDVETFANLPSATTPTSAGPAPADTPVLYETNTNNVSYSWDEGGAKLYYKDSQNWNTAYAYFWKYGGNSSQNNGSLQVMSPEGNNVYSIEVPDYADRVIFSSDNSWNNKTDDLTLPGDIHTKSYIYQYSSPGTYTDGRLRFDNRELNWEKVYAYFFKSNNEVVGREWNNVTAAGSNQELTYLSTDDPGILSINMDSFLDADYIIFRDNNYHQSMDILLSGHKTNDIFNPLDEKFYVKDAWTNADSKCWITLIGNANGGGEGAKVVFKDNRRISSVAYLDSQEYNYFNFKYDNSGSDESDSFDISNYAEHGRGQLFEVYGKSSYSYVGIGLGSWGASGEWDFDEYGSDIQSHTITYQPEDRYGYITTVKSNAGDNDGTATTFNNYIGITANGIADPYISFYDNTGGTGTPIGGEGISLENAVLNPVQNETDVPAKTGTGTYIVRLPKNAKSFKIGDGTNLSDAKVLDDSKEYVFTVTASVSGITISDPADRSTHNSTVSDPEFKTDDSYIYFTDQNDWDNSGAIYAYFYGGTDGEYNAWPGIRASGSYTDTNGKTVYYFLPPSQTSGNTTEYPYPFVIFNNGSEPTRNITQKIEYSTGKIYTPNSNTASYGETTTAAAACTETAKTADGYTGTAYTKYSPSEKFIYIVNNGTADLQNYPNNVNTRTKLDDLHVTFYKTENGGQVPVGTASPGYYADKLEYGSYNGSDVFRISVPDDATEFKISNGTGKGTGNVNTGSYRESVITKLSINGLYRFVDSTDDPGAIDNYWQSESVPTSADQLDDHAYFLTLINEREEEVEDDEPVIVDTTPVYLATVVTGNDGLIKYIENLRRVSDEENAEVDTEYLDHTTADINNPAVHNVRVKKWGKYFWKEVEPPVGYEADAEVLETFSVAEGEAERSVNVFTASDTRKHGSITLTKNSEQALGNRPIGSPLADAEFELYKDTDSAEQILLLKKKGENTYRVPTVKENKSSIVSNSYLNVTDTDMLTELADYELYDNTAGQFKLYSAAVTGTDVTIQSYNGETMKGEYTVKNGVFTVPEADKDSSGDYNLRITNLPIGCTYRIAYTNGTAITVTGSATLVPSGTGTAYLAATVSNISGDLEFKLQRSFDNGTNWSDVSIGRLRIENIDWGDYYLQESKAPEGYSNLDTKTPGEINKVTFSVGRNNCETDQQLDCTDEIKPAELKIVKNLDEYLAAWGTPTFVFKIKKVTSESSASEYEKIVCMKIEDGDTKKNETDFMKIEPGAYQITELNVSRYTPDGCTIEYNESNLVTNQSTIGYVASFTVAAGGKVTVTFHNKIEYYDKFSHTDVAENKVNAAVKGIEIENYHNVPINITPAEINKTDLEAYFILSDGTRRAMDDEEKEKLSVAYIAQTNDDTRFANRFDDDAESKKLVITEPNLFADGVYRLRATYRELDKDLTCDFDIVFDGKRKEEKKYEKTFIIHADNNNLSYFEDEGYHCKASESGVITVPAGYVSGKTIYADITGLPATDKDGLSYTYYVDKCDSSGNITGSASCTSQTPDGIVTLSITSPLGEETAAHFIVKRKTNTQTEAETVKTYSDLSPVTMILKNRTSQLEYTFSMKWVKGENEGEGSYDVLSVRHNGYEVSIEDVYAVINNSDNKLKVIETHSNAKKFSNSWIRSSTSYESSMLVSTELLALAKNNDNNKVIDFTAVLKDKTEP